MPRKGDVQRNSKAEIAAALKQRANIERQRTIARMVFPAVEQLETVYDAQTVFNAVAGHIKYGLILKENELKISDLAIDMAKGKDSAVKHAVVTVLEMLRDEPANDMAKLLDMMGQKLPEFLANKALKGPMSTVTAAEFIAD